MKLPEKFYNVKIISPNIYHSCTANMGITEQGIHLINKSNNDHPKQVIPHILVVDYRLEAQATRAKNRLRLGYFKQSTDRLKDKLITLHFVCLILQFQTPDDMKEIADQLTEYKQRLQYINEAEKPYLILINPCSGRGDASYLFNTKVKPIFVRLKIPFKTLETQYPKHAEEYISKLSDTELEGYRAIITISGDGLLNEVANGVASRLSKFKPVLGTLPAGSGNSTAASICYHSGLSDQSQLLSHSVFLLTLPSQGSIKKVSETLNTSIPTTSDLPSLQSNTAMGVMLCECGPQNNRRIGILSVVWGMVASMDLNSERLRCLGKLRFPIYAYYYILRRPVYQARISYLPAFDDSKLTSGKTDSIDSIEILKSDEVDTSSNQEVQLIQRKFRYLPDFDKPIPSSWVTIEGEFVTVLVMNQSHISSDCILFPKTKFNDGYMNLCLVKGNTTRSDLLRLGQQLHTYNGISSNNFMDVISVKAVRVEPTSNKNVITMLDGELVPPGHFQVELIESCYQVILGSKGS